MRCLRLRAVGVVMVSRKAFNHHNVADDCNSRLFPVQIIGGSGMKIVVVKSPKLIGGILRIIFGIKKEAIQ